MGKILFIRGGAIGDFILTLPAIQLVKENLPDAQIEVLGYPGIASLAVESGLAEDTRSMEDAGLSQFFIPGTKLPQDWVGYFAGFDVVISYLYDPDLFFETNLRQAGVDTLFVGPYQIDESAGIHASAQLAKPLEQLALFYENKPASLSFESDATLLEGAPIVAVHPGSGSPKKNWLLEGWLEVLMGILKEKPGAQFVVVSGEAERETIGTFLKMLSLSGVPSTHLENQPLPLLGAALAQCDLFVGHDTGIGHLAASVGIPCVLLFGPTSPAVWAPLGKKVIPVQHESCQLYRIDLNEVIEIALQQL